MSAESTHNPGSLNADELAADLTSRLDGQLDGLLRSIESTAEALDRQLGGSSDAPASKASGNEPELGAAVATDPEVARAPVTGADASVDAESGGESAPVPRGASHDDENPHAAGDRLKDREAAEDVAPAEVANQPWAGRDDEPGAAEVAPPAGDLAAQDQPEEAAGVAAAAAEAATGLDVDLGAGAAELAKQSRLQDETPADLGDLAALALTDESSVSDADEPAGEHEAASVGPGAGTAVSSAEVDALLTEAELVPKASIGEVDDELLRVTDAMLRGEDAFAAHLGSRAAAESTGPGAEAEPAARSASDSRGVSGVPPAPGDAAAVVGRPAVVAAPAATGAVVEASPRCWARANGRFLKTLKPAAVWMATMSAKPIAGRPREQRLAINVLASGTAVSAMLLWGFVLLRPQAVQTASAGTHDFVQAAPPELPGDTAGNGPHTNRKAGEHGEGKDDHGKAKKGDEGHGAKKDPKKDAKKADGHGAKKDAGKDPKKKPAKADEKKKAGSKSDGKNTNKKEAPAKGGH